MPRWQSCNPRMWFFNIRICAQATNIWITICVGWKQLNWYCYTGGLPNQPPLFDTQHNHMIWFFLPQICWHWLQIRERTNRHTYMSNCCLLSSSWYNSLSLLGNCCLYMSYPIHKLKNILDIILSLKKYQHFFHDSVAGSYWQSFSHAERSNEESPTISLS